MIDRERIIDTLKKILSELNIDYFKIILFGSRAKGEGTEGSDWDFYIIINNISSEQERRKLWYHVYRMFHQYFPITPVDIVIKDRESYELEKTIINTLSYEVTVEGLEV